MLRSTFATTVLLAAATPVLAQRAEENVIKAADDAFGTSVGNEKIGLYGASDVRGFNPASAGNIRIEGLAITEHGGFTPRIASGSTVRVGLTAQGYPFPAPTGIVDHALRTADADAVLSPILYYGPNRTAAFDIDAQLPIAGDRLGVAAGIAYRYEEALPGEDSRTLQAGAVLRWQPSDRIELKSFYGRMAVTDDLDVGNIFTAGPYLPPKIERRYFGLDWTQTEVQRQFYGGLGSIRLTDDWQLRAGLFRSENHVILNPVELYRNVQPDGTAQRQVVTTKDQTARSISGEVRSIFSLTEGPRRHGFIVALRGRQTERRYGGADVRDLGEAVVGSRSDIDRPDFKFGALSRDRIRQFTGGFGYELRWPGVAELSAGLQKTDYRRVIAVPGLQPLRVTSSPWLYNATLAIHLTGKLLVYGGYTRGLEESGVAPANAVNRNSATTALRTSQRDAGLRYAVMPRLNFVAGVFDVRKPYFNLDPDRVFRQLGTVRHRGVELSLAGQPINGLNVVAGAVFLDAQVSGEAVDLGIIGPKPVGTAARRIRANFDYRLPRFDALSIDLGVTVQAGKIASALEYAELGGRQLTTRPQTTIDLGARYRFNLGSARATLRAQVTNLFDVYRWDVGSNSSFKFNDARRMLLTLAADF